MVLVHKLPIGELSRIKQPWFAEAILEFVADFERLHYSEIECLMSLMWNPSFSHAQKDMAIFQAFLLGGPCCNSEGWDDGSVQIDGSISANSAHISRKWIISPKGKSTTQVDQCLQFALT